MAPTVWEQGRWFLCSLAVGFGLALVYWVLAALRHRFPRTRFWADGAFLVLVAWSLAWLALVVSRGQYGVPHLLGLGAGATGWSVTLGPVCSPLFHRFWGAVGRLGGLLLMPVKILAKKTKKIAKKPFSTWKKWGTIDTPWPKAQKRHPSRNRVPQPHAGEKGRVRPKRNRGY